MRRIRVRVAIPHAYPVCLYDGTWTNTQCDLDNLRVSRENQSRWQLTMFFFCYGRLLKRIRIVVFTTQTQIRYRKRYTRCPEHVCSSGVDPDLFLLGTNSVRLMTFDSRIVLRFSCYKCKHGNYEWHICLWKRHVNFTISRTSLDLRYISYFEVE